MKSKETRVVATPADILVPLNPNSATAIWTEI